MRRFLALALAAGILMAARPVPVEPKIILNEAGPFAIGDPVTFEVVVPKLRDAYPMVYLECLAPDGSVLYGQLDHPDVTFILGGGSSRWWIVGGPATCTGYLYAYERPGPHQSITLLDQTAAFPAN